MNVYSHWDVIAGSGGWTNMLGNGLGYFSVGAAGTAVSMVNPAAGAAIMTGEMPRFHWLMDKHLIPHP